MPSILYAFSAAKQHGPLHCSYTRWAIMRRHTTKQPRKGMSGPPQGVDPDSDDELELLLLAAEGLERRPVVVPPPIPTSAEPDAEPGVAKRARAGSGPSDFRWPSPRRRSLGHSHAAPSVAPQQMVGNGQANPSAIPAAGGVWPQPTPNVGPARDEVWPQPKLRIAFGGAGPRPTPNSATPPHGVQPQPKTITQMPPLKMEDKAAKSRAEEEHEWIRHMLTQVSSQQARLLRRVDRRVLLELFGVWRLGAKVLERTELATCVDRFLQLRSKAVAPPLRWPPPARINVMVDVVHLSGGHGTGMVCSEQACKLLRDAEGFGGLGVNVYMNSIQHFTVDCVQNHGSELYEAFKLVHPCTRRMERLRGYDVHQATQAAQNLHGWTIAGCPSVVLLIVDLAAFRDRVLRDNDLHAVWDRQRLQQLKSWIKTLVAGVGLDRMTSVMLEVRHNHNTACEMLGKNFGASYLFDAGKAVNGLDRPMTVCAHPCAQALWRGAKVEDLTRGSSITSFVTPMSDDDQSYWATMVHDDNRFWCPTPNTSVGKLKAPVELDATWPEVLQRRVECTDEPCAREQVMCQVHRVRVPNTNDIRHAGPEYFAHFLGLDLPDMLTRAREVFPCLGLINVLSGDPANDCPPSQDDTVDLCWRERCGVVVLCRNCSRLVKQLGSSFEVKSTSDIIARHLGARIRQTILGEIGPPLDSDSSTQLLHGDLWWPEELDLIE